MPLYFNGTNLPSGSKQYWNGTALTKIYFNDVEVWNYDNTPPVITITSSLDDTVNLDYTLTGTVIDTDSGVASLKFNNYEIQFDQSGNFSVDIVLSNGTNTFTLVATDNAGNVSQPLEVSIKAYNDKDNPDAQWTKVGWKPAQADNTTCYYVVSVDGTEYNICKWRRNVVSDHGRATPNTGSFSSTIPLPKGLKHITIYATANAGGGNSQGMTAHGEHTIKIVDDDTSEILASGTGSWSKDSGSETHSGNWHQSTIDMDLTVTQSMKNLSVRISGQANGCESDICDAWVGIGTWASGYARWSFEYY